MRHDQASPTRAELPRLLQALGEAHVQETMATIAAAYRIEDVTLPQSGLGLLKLKDGAMHEAYYPGEIPLSSAHVVLSSSHVRAEGAARILHDSATLARAIAIADAIFGSDLPEKPALAQLMREGASRLAAEASARRKMLARTRVDFSLLGSAEGEDSDE